MVKCNAKVCIILESQYHNDKGYTIIIKACDDYKLNNNSNNTACVYHKIT